MKKLSLLTILGLLVVVGCENMKNDNDISLDDPELQALAEGLNADIGLSKSSDDAFKDALNRHGKDGKHRRDPGFLWKVAAEMQENLTQDEKDKMFSWMDKHAITFLHAPDKKDHRGPKGDKGGVDLRLMMTVLDSDQQEALKIIMDTYRSQMEEVMRAMREGSKDEATAKAEIEALELSMKNEIDSLLTDDQKNKIDQLLNDLSIEHIRNSNGGNLSGGERRRVEIARTLAMDPDFILLDEPFAGVDPIAVEDIQSIVSSLKQKNIGVLITDHNVRETLSITDRSYLLFDGNILKSGSSEFLANDDEARRLYLGESFSL